jgi:NAD+ kinase
VSKIESIGVLAHPLRPQTYPIADQICKKLEAHGLRAWSYTDWQQEEVLSDVKGADMIIAIGGDGAMLRAARVSAPHNVPVLGINMGQLGFLTEIPDPHDWQSQLERVLTGDYWIEQRMMIRTEVWADDACRISGEALNDIVVSGDVVGRMIQLDTYIDADWATTYHADALVVATATGSTAYALACGGPILPPELKNILIVPAAPHLSMDRPIVLAEGACVDIMPSSKSTTNIVLSADGSTLCEIKHGERVRVQASDHITRFVRLRSRNYFYRSLLDRLEPRVQRHNADKKRNVALDELQES